MTLKLEGDLYILKMYLLNENKAAILKHSKLRARIEKYKIHPKVIGQGQMLKASNQF